MEAISKLESKAQDVQVSAKSQRRRFTKEFKLRVVREADACSKPGEVGALLRREGVYSSSLALWRLSRDRGELLKAPKRGRKANRIDPSTARIAGLENENRKLTARAERAEALVDLQKKIAELLGSPVRGELT